MERRTAWLIVALTATCCGLLIAALVGAQHAAGEHAPAVRDALLPLVGGGIVVTVLLGALLWGTLRRQVFGALGVIARDVLTLLQAPRVDRPLRVPPRHGLGALPEAVSKLTDELRGARREVVRAMATATARTEQEKEWLELILLELAPHGVVVCNLDHRILLYNQTAARLFRKREALGLGRSLLELVTGAPLAHALERLELRLKDGRRDLSVAFVCAAQDGPRMLQARMSLVLDAMRAATGYAISLEDISEELEAQAAGSRLRRTLTRDLRGPVGSLRAAAETLAGAPDLDDDDRRAFQQVISDECARLSDMVEMLSDAAEAQSAREWPLAEIHSPDLFACVAPRLETGHGVRLHHAGSPAWITGDSHQLMMALVELGAAAAARAGVGELEVEAGHRDVRGYLELRWHGEAVPERELDGWLDRPLGEAPDTTVRQVLERHACEPWSQALRDGRAVLHLPLPAADAPEDEADVAGHAPQLYDFDLMGGASLRGELGERRLKDLSYVVFDTETTGLRPAAGDEIISIAGVRVTQGRVLENEVFESLVNPGRPIPRDSIRFHGITDDQVAHEPPIARVLPRFREFAGDAVLVAHNAAFDMKFIKLKEAQCGLSFDNPVVDTLLLSLLVEGADEDHTLDGICDRLGIHIQERHSALGDAMATAHVLAHLLERLEARGLATFHQVMAATNMPEQLRIRGDQF